MATRAEQARLFNEAIAQGLTEDQALAVAGITNPNDFTYGYGTGKLEPLVIGPPKRTDIEVVSNLADPYPDDEPKYRTVPVSSSSTTTTQTTVTGGTETVTRVTPTTYKDTSQSLALQGQADSVAAQQQARADQLRAEGKTGGQILRDPEYRRLSAEKQNLQDQAQNAKAVDQAGAVTTTVTPGPTSSVTETTVDGKFLTKDTSGYDPTAGAQQANQFVASGGLVENRQPLTATEIADYQNQTATRVNETGAKFQEPFVSDQAAAAEAAYYEANPNEVRAVLAAPPPAEPVVTTTTVEITDAELFAPANTTNTNPGPGYTAPVAAEPTDGELYRKPLGIGGNYSSVYNPETGLYDVVDIDTGRTVDSGLSELNAEVTASQFSQGDPQFETPEMPPELPDLTEPEPPGGNFGSVFDPETQSWSVIDNDTGVIVQTGFNDAASAELQAQLDSQPDPYANQFTDDDINASFTESDLVREPTDQDVIENDARITGENVGIVRTEPAPVGLTESEVIGDFSADPRIAGENVGLDTPAVVTDAARNRAQVQATLANQQRQADSGDWRFKIRLAPGARYLYRGDNGQGVQSGILAPLAVTDGVVFPYTPQVSTNYSARYTEADLPHSNYRGYFYNISYVDSVQIEGTFTAQDTAEANYLLAVIHFFRSVTKMFYGQASEFRGAPPPLVFLQGFGAYQFSRHPCVISSFRYTLPRDVDYIRADVQPISGLNIQQQRKPGGVPPQSLPTNVFTGALARLAAAGVPKGAVFRPQAPDTLGTRSPTYVPTKMDITLELLPMQTRQQVSQEFNNRDFATGALQKKGFW